MMLVRTSLVSLALVGCGSDTLDDPDNIQIWATNGSAVAVYSNIREPVAFADGFFAYPDPNCPVTSDDGSTVRIMGGCTDDEGSVWVGDATIVRTAGGTRMLTLNDFGRDDGELPSQLTGTAEIRSTGRSHEFDVNIMRDGVTSTTIVYNGTVAGDYESPTRWNGSGTVDRDGFGDALGIVSAETVDQVMDDTICQGQPASGQTTFRSDDETAVVTYDGATACDEAAAARWSFNGEDRGLVTGINCSTVAVGARGALPVGGILCIGALVLARGLRRRRVLAR